MSKYLGHYCMWFLNLIIGGRYRLWSWRKRSEVSQAGLKVSNDPGLIKQCIVTSVWENLKLRYFTTGICLYMDNELTRPVIWIILMFIMDCQVIARLKVIYNVYKRSQITSYITPWSISLFHPSEIQSILLIVIPNSADSKWQRIWGCIIWMDILLSTLALFHRRDNFSLLKRP